jgi:hypothetical protein
MAEVFAGWVMGFALSVIIAPFLAWSLVSARHSEPWVRRLAPESTNIIALTMFLHLLAALLCTALGLVLGMALSGMEDHRPAGGLGSPNAAYTLLVIALTAAAVIPTLAFPALRRYALPLAVLFVVLFGWATPWLAQAG